MLFTIILEFDGVNSVSQVVAPDAQAAFRGWVKGLDKPRNYGLNDQQAHSIGQALAIDRELHLGLDEFLGTNEEELTPLDGTRNVWCKLVFTGKEQKETVLLNIVATVSKAATSNRKRKIGKRQ